MTPALSIKKREIFLLALTMTIGISTFSQQKAKPNKNYNTVVTRESLDKVLTIDDIQSITVTNNSGSHQLTKTELTVLKKQLKDAKFAGGQLVKPGHITLSIKFKSTFKSEGRICLCL